MAKCDYCGAEGMTCIYGQVNLCEFCSGSYYAAVLMLREAMKELARRIKEEWAKIFPFVQADDDCFAELDRKARAWREQRITALADQLPPKALTMRRIMPRARRNLPAGMRRRWEEC